MQSAEKTETLQEERVNLPAQVLKPAEMLAAMTGKGKRYRLDRKENLVFSLRKAMYRWGEAETEDTLTLLLQAQPQIPWQQELMLARQGVWKLSQLAVDGQLLMQAGCPKGPMVGQVLNRLLELCIEERLDNRRDLLLQRASELWR